MKGSVQNIIMTELLEECSKQLGMFLKKFTSSEKVIIIFLMNLLQLANNSKNLLKKK